MSDDGKSGPDWSLKNEIKQRKTQEIIRASEVNRMARTGKTRPLSQSFASSPATPKRTTQEVAQAISQKIPQPSSTVVPSKRATVEVRTPRPLIEAKQRDKLIVIAAAIIALTICMSTMLIAG